MAKLVKQFRYTKDGKALINCYHINISKEVLNNSDIKDSDEIIVYAENGRIIVEKKK